MYDQVPGTLDCAAAKSLTRIVSSRLSLSGLAMNIAMRGA